MEKYTDFDENGLVKETGSKVNGEKHGWVIIYKNGIEFEKVQYQNGIFLGNPFTGKTAEEIIKAFGGDLAEEFNGEESEDSTLLTKEEASTMLQGEKYYGKN